MAILLEFSERIEDCIRESKTKHLKQRIIHVHLHMYRDHNHAEVIGKTKLKRTEIAANKNKNETEMRYIRMHVYI